MSIRITLQTDSADDVEVVSVLAVALKDYLDALGCSVGVVDEHHADTLQLVEEWELRLRLLYRDQARLKVFAHLLQSSQVTVWCGSPAKEPFDDKPQHKQADRAWKLCGISRRRTTVNLCPPGIGERREHDHPKSLCTFLGNTAGFCFSRPKPTTPSP